MSLSPAGRIKNIAYGFGDFRLHDGFMHDGFDTQLTGTRLRHASAVSGAYDNGDIRANLFSFGVAPSQYIDIITKKAYLVYSKWP